jgi:membrane protein implicated in regulation of membrane protease activity
MNSAIGNWLIILGLFLVIAGVIAKTGVFGWFGQLPGDVHIKREGFQFFLPITSMLIVSVVLSLLVSLVRRFL